MFEQFPSPATVETKNDLPEKAILVSVVIENADLMDPDSSLDELEELLKTAGGISIGRMIQVKKKPDNATFIGSGKLAELCDFCRALSADLVVFDCELTPSQIRNIELALGEVRVIDRTMLILDIFAQNAKTSEGIVQVAIANLKYSLPRLSGQGQDLSRLGGGIGTRGPGETKLETDRRHVKRKIQKLEEELRELNQNRQTQRKTRERSGVFRIALAGYTNAGKSSLLNLLCEESILAQNKLFATLDPTTRRFGLPCGEEALLTDTVGFINRLPHHLVEAFQSTLDEVVYSDLVLLVMDAADPKFFQKMQITEQILEDLYRKRNATPPRTLYLLNKCDLPESVFHLHAFPKSKEHLPLSAKTGHGKAALLKKIEEIMAETKKSLLFFFPHAEAGKLSVLYQSATMKDVRYEEDGIYAEALCDEKTRGALAKFIKKD